ncbi:phasin family protein [Beggiatoa alba B18LD]|uniref:Phasin family protein n=1 Tax=Beggiatoa alba B18LD TaxID=395493 RepID=I3CJ25_9GAMM|nr:phasin family protein [Beggiatoa alba]EIJ43618.1 phasin family protein [Beggiatoa alba B18LD]
MKEQVKKWADLNKSNVAAVQKLADINTNLATALLRQQMDILSIYADNSVKQIQALTEAKRVQDLFAIQAEATQELNKKVLNNARITVEILVDSKSQIASLVEDNLKSISTFNPLAKAA